MELWVISIIGFVLGVALGISRSLLVSSEAKVLTMAVDWFEVGDTLTLSDNQEYEIISKARGSQYTEYRIAKVKRAGIKKTELAV